MELFIRNDKTSLHINTKKASVAEAFFVEMTLCEKDYFLYNTSLTAFTVRSTFGSVASIKVGA